MQRLAAVVFCSACIDRPAEIEEKSDILQPNPDRLVDGTAFEKGYSL